MRRSTTYACAGGVPAAKQLEIAPNPFRPRTELRFHVPMAGRVRLSVLDVTGRRIVDLADRDYPAGAQRVVWDGRDGRGRAVPAGLYFVRLEATGMTATRSVTRLR